MACSTTLVTNGVCLVDITRHPKIRREYTSTRNATYTNPATVHTYVKSATHIWSGTVDAAVAFPHLVDRVRVVGLQHRFGIWPACLLA